MLDFEVKILKLKKIRQNMNTQEEWREKKDKEIRFEENIYRGRVGQKT